MAVSESVSVDIVVNTQQAQSNLTNFARQIGIATVGINELVQFTKKAADVVIEFAKDSVNEWANYELAVTNLESVLKATGGAIGYTSKELVDMAGALQETTMYGDETVISAQSVMATFKQIGREVFPEAIKAAMDMATVMKMDLQSAAVMVGKALNDPIQGVGALRRVGVQLTEQQEEMIKKFMEVNDVAGAQGVIMGELKSQFGGAAEAAGDTLLGSMTQLNNAFGDLKKAIGEMLSASLRPAVDALKEFVNLVTSAIKHESLLNEALAKQNDYRTISTQKLLEYAKALQNAIDMNKSAMLYDPSGILTIEKGRQNEEYLKLLSQINSVIDRRPKTLEQTVELTKKEVELNKELEKSQEWITIKSETFTNRTKQAIDADNQSEFVLEYIEDIEKAIEATYTWADANKYLEESLGRVAASSFVDSMEMLGELAYSAGMSVDDLGASIANMGRQILNSLPQMFLQAGLQAIIMGNWGLGLALIAMAGTTAFSAGYVNAAIEDTKESKKSTVSATSKSVTPSTTVNIENNSGTNATATERTAADGSKIIDVVIGTVNQGIARGSFDGAMGSRYGVRYSGVRK